VIEYTKLVCGDMYYYSGVLYTARDMAHKRIFDSLRQGLSLPFPLKNSAIFYAGPIWVDGKIISCGPTTSARMDKFTPELLNSGVKILIGKGERSLPVVQAIKKNRAIYFSAIGGCGALYAKCITHQKIKAYSSLGTEAIAKLIVDKMPLIVAIDSNGGSIYE